MACRPLRIDAIRTAQHSSSARAFAHDAATVKAEFLNHDMPDDFLENLKRSIADFENAIRTQDGGKGTDRAARTSFDGAMENGLAAVRRLEAIVGNRLRNEPSLLTVWEHARRVEYPGARRNGSGTQPGVAPAGAGTPGSQQIAT